VNNVDHLDKIRLYLKSIEDGDYAPIAEIFDQDAVMEQFPNRIYPKGISSGVTAMEEAFKKGRKLLSSQNYKIKNHLVQGDQVAVEVLWTGRLAIAFGSMAAGSEMRCHSAMFFDFKDGKVVRQRNYDCFLPW